MKSCKSNKTRAGGGLNKSELVALAEARGHRTAKTMTRAQLLDVLCEHGAPAKSKPKRKNKGPLVAPPVVVDVSKLEPSCAGKYGFNGGFDTDQLRLIARARGLPGADVLTRPEMLHLLCESERRVTKSDLITFLPIGEFETRYRLNFARKLGHGAYGAVYQTADGNHAVKVFQSSTMQALSKDAIAEIGWYAMISHPCITRPVAWSFNQYTRTAFIAMPKGIPIEAALLDGRITPRELISDTLSAVAYLNSLGIAHCDIKPQNMIFHDGHAKLIDMGLAQYGALFGDGRWYITGMAYTESWKDPEYVETQWNSITADIYALAKACYNAISGAHWSTNDSYSFSSEDPEIQWFYHQAQKFASDRLTGMDLLELARTEAPGLIVRVHMGVQLDTPVLPYDPTCADQTAKILHRVYDLCRKRKVIARILFGALHLLHRTLSIFAPNYATDISKARHLPEICVYLATIAYQPSIAIEPEFASGSTFNMIAEVIDIVGGVIGGVTYWDYASCLEDLPDMLSRAMSCDYDPSNVGTLRFTGNSKDINTDDIPIMSEADAKRNVRADHKYSNVGKLQIEPTVPYESIDMIRSIWSRLTDAFMAGSHPVPNSFELAVLLHNRNRLKEVSLPAAIIIYHILKDPRIHGMWDSAISKLFQFDWTRVSPDAMLRSGLHPWGSRAPTAEQPTA